MDIDDDCYAINIPGQSKLSFASGGTTCACVLCEYADDTGGAMHYLKQLDVALGGRTDDEILSRMQEQSYRNLFYLPMKERGLDVPQLTAAEIREHFATHDINPLRVLRKDMVKLESMQQKLETGGDLEYNANDARQWTNIERLKMDLVKQYEQTDHKTTRELPIAPTI